MKKEITKEQLEELYIKQNLSKKEVCKILKISKGKFSRLEERFQLHKSMEQIRGRAKQTTVERYGVENIMNNLEIKNKIAQTNLQKYGSISPFGNKEVQEKASRTILENYGVDNYSKTEEYKEKYKQTCLEKYGVESYSKTEEYKNQIKNTSINKYGYDNPSKSPIIKEKTYQTNLKKYGCHPTQTQEVKEKFKQLYSTGVPQDKCNKTKHKNGSFNISKTEEDVYQLLLTKFDKEDIIRQYKSKIYKWACDFYIKSLDLFIEFQGTWVHGREPFNRDKVEHQIKLDKWKSKETEYFNYAIKIWTKIDPLKRETARKNNLSFIELWSLKEAKKFIETL